MTYFDPHSGHVSTLIRATQQIIVPPVKNPYETRLIVSANLAALMKSRPDLSTPRAISSAGGGKPSKSTIQRMQSKESACDIDNLSAIAKVFGISPWQLLIPGLQPSNPQILKEMTVSEAAMYAKFQEMIDLAKAKD